MARLTIQLLGPFHVTLDGEPITGFESNKVRALLACLVMECNRPHSREALAGLLWPDHPERTARHNLRQALSNLRQAIGDRTASGDRDADPPFLQIARRTVQFNPDSDYQLDASRFDALVATSEAHAHTRLETCNPCIQRLEEAVELYRGEFLDGLFVADSVAFEEWALLRRERFHRLAMDKLYHLANHSERCRDYDRARRHARRQVELEPWREEAHQQLMRLLARSGQRSTAISQYERCRRALAEELGVEPDEETQMLYERIRAARVSRPHNLPTQLTPFFGRQEELSEIAERLGKPACRLLTLVGPGGIGKTRLALQAAAEQVGSFLNGIFFIPLAAVRSTRFLAATVAEAIGFVFSGEDDPPAQLLNYLRDKEMLLVMDNFEHLLASSNEGETELLVAILEQALQAKILVTSREPLHLRAEWLMDIEGLALPEPDNGQGTETYSAIRLFVESAHRVDADFCFAGETVPATIRICQLVEGMPLGIELAAAAVRAHSCEQIAAQIEKDLDFLATSMRDVPARHRSMRAVFDHSWRLLTGAEQEVIAKLSVFRGSFHTEAARTIAGATPDMLAALANRSFLSQDEAGQYSLHQLLKQYSAQELAQSPHQQEAARALHGRYYAEFLHCQEEGLKGPRQHEIVDELGVVVEDIRAAWDWAVAHQDSEAIGLSIWSLYHFYWARNLFLEGSEAFEQAARSVQALKEDNDLLLAKIRTHQAEFDSWLGKYDQARKLLDQSIAVFRAHQAHSELGIALAALCRLGVWLGDYATAGECSRESLIIFRQLGDKYWIAGALINLATVICEETADLEQARPLYEEGLALMREVGDRIGEANILNDQGALAYEQGDYAEAQRLFGEGLELYRAVGYRRGVSIALNNLGLIASEQGDHATARELIHESLDIKREIGNRGAMVNSLYELGNVTRKAGEYRESSRWYRQALELAWEIQALHMVRHVIAGIARLLNRQDKKDRALELLYFVAHQGIGEQLLTDQVNDLIAKLEEELPPHRVTRCRERGQGMALDTVVADILDQNNTNQQHAQEARSH